LPVADLIEPIHKQGLSAGLLRQATYTTARLGIHAKLVDYLKEMNKGAPLPLAQKAGAGLAAGGLGAIFGSPADLSLIRMQADKTLPVAERRNYTGVVHALSDTVKKEGIGGLFTGAGTTSIRAMALNMGMLASNDQAKEMMKENGITGFTATLGASSIAGFFASFFSLPFDYVKTQLQKQKPLPDGTLPFKGFGDCCAKTMAAGGPLKFYTGFPTYYVRIAPHAMFTLILLDQINVMQKSAGM
jgi:solute carrier family 25 oxoglutarate transporter 11